MEFDLKELFAATQHQKDLEAEMRSLGIVRYRNKLIEAKEKAQESTTSPGLTLLKKVIPKMAQGIDDYYKTSHLERKNRKGLAFKKLKHFPSRTLSYITFKTVLDSISSVEPVQSTALRIGSLLEDELRFKSYKKQNPELLKTLKDDLNKRTQNYRHQRTVIIHSANKANLEWKHWSKIDKCRIGIKCLEFLIKTTGLFEYQHYRRTNSYKKILCVQPKAELLEWIDKRNLIMEAMSPVFLPMVVQPVPWTNPYDGGYTDEFFNKLSLVKTYNDDYLRKLEEHKMPQVYQALNNLQRTEWKVNKKVYEVMKHHWDNRSDLPCMPELNEMVIPPKPEDFDTNEESKVDWKRRVAKLYQENIRNRSKKMAWTKLIWMAEKFKETPSLYFPYNLDFRGRAYCVSSYLTPQGPDESKGLLEFADEQVIGDTGLLWLGIHGANCFGEDKVSLTDRSRWAAEYSERIKLCAKDPYTNKWWMEADKPWQFLAFCFEYSRINHNPFSVTSLPCTVDGSCNGLQHFSAMLRDEAGGEVTNLIPKDKPADIYQVVADLCKKKNDEELVSNEYVGRSLTKRPVMTTPYGATLFGIREQIMDEIQKQEEKGTKFPFTEEKWKATCYLSRLVWESIGETVVAAREAMSWLQEVARVATANGKMLYWETPVGFPVYQEYKKLTVKRIPLGVGKAYRLVNFQEPGDQLDGRRQVNGVSPNLVHSYDSAHMMKVINRCEFEGIDSFMMVHDCFGVHANNMTKLNAIIRAEFVDMYEKFSPLQGIYDSMKLDGLDIPPPPEMRNLDINQVLDSEYFFS